MAKSFHELSQRAQMIVFGLLCVLAAAGAWQVSIGPSSVELETRRAHLAKLEGEIVRVQAITDKLPALQREVKALSAALIETTAAIPEEKDPQDVLRHLLEVATMLPRPLGFVRVLMVMSLTEISRDMPASRSKKRPSSW